MRAFRYCPGHSMRVENIPEAVPVKDQVKIQVQWCGICGSDLHVYQAFMAASKKDSPKEAKGTAVTMGHEFSGTVAAVGPECTRFQPGDRVVAEAIVACGTCPACVAGMPNVCRKSGCLGFGSHDGAFAEFCLVPQARVHKIPDSLSFEQGAIVEPLSVACHSVWAGKFQKGQTAIVAGAGPIGLATIALLKTYGAKKIVVLQRTSIRQQYAKAMGADLVLDPNIDQIPGALRAFWGEAIADVAFETTGSPQCFSILLNSIRPAGRLIVTSLWQEPVTLDLNPLVLREKTVTGVYGYTGREYDEVISLLSSGKLSVPGYITKKIHLDHILDEGFATLTGPDKKAHVKILVTPRKELLS